MPPDDHTFINKKKMIEGYNINDTMKVSIFIYFKGPAICTNFDLLRPYAISTIRTTARKFQKLAPSLAHIHAPTFGSDNHPKEKNFLLESKKIASVPQ